MIAASASHRLLNFVQSALLLGLMAAIAWIAVTAIVGPETNLLMALAMVGGLLFAPGHCYFNESADVTYSLAHLSCGFQARDFAPHVSGGLS